ncbi:DUF523 domain-containing protein [Orenia marismortui]|uniref:DUF523 domain-containing protein n=1 Tax=Orenia marismortui TaxID=46469 RepID=UPI00036A3567|nr:DUF523 domain-containing protein [Orenia marismortui]
MIAVSACLLGENCKYNGQNNYNRRLIELLEGKEIITICPEELGGLSTPRLAAEIIDGDGKDVLLGEAKVINKNNEDITANFVKGANKSINLLRKKNCSFAILKARSPSCGSKQIYDGSFSAKKKAGIGVTAALLEKEGIRVYNEEELDEVIFKEYHK